MPTVLTVGPYRFFFYAGEVMAEPPHVHVRRERHTTKLWLGPVRVARAGGFPETELIRIVRLTEQHEKSLTDAYNDARNA